MEKHSYNVSLQWKEGRIGEMTSPELPTKIDVATPPEFDKGVAGIWSPEHLYTASVLSCYMTTFLAIAEYSKLEFNSFDCSAEGILEKVDGKFLMTEITLKPVLVIEDDAKKDRALRIMEKSEKACLISNSIKTTVHLDAKVEIETQVKA
ncbi:MAG: OsmC family protein [Flavobacteriales bacterium]|nr:OsmC family protein [Flavobacteriales bacterium]